MDNTALFYIVMPKHYYEDISGTGMKPGCSIKQRIYLPISRRDSMNQNIGNVISQSRQNRKMTQEEFAARLGVTPQAVSKWERGNGLPDISLVQGICEILGISPNTLFGREENRVTETGHVLQEQTIKSNMFAEPLVVEFGMGLIPYFAEGLKTDMVNRKRMELVKNTGILLPVLHIRDNSELEEKEVRILSYDKLIWSKVWETTDENTYEQILDQIVYECQSHYDTIINKHIVKIMMDYIKETYPGMIDGLIPEKISYLQVQKKLQEILQERGEIRDMIHILEQLETELE